MSKVEENRLRRKARRHGLFIRKTRRRDPDALDYGRYAIFDADHGGCCHAGSPINTPYALTLEDVAAFIDGPDDSVVSHH